MLIRAELNANKSWKFEDTFDDYQEPDMLHNLLNWIIRGRKRCHASQNRELQLYKVVNNITQIICQNVKSDRQINYKSQSTQNVRFHDRTETSFSVELGLMFYKHTRSKHINLLLDMNLTIDYDKNLKIETNIADAIVKKMEDIDGVYLPPSIQKKCPIYFAVDNCNFQNDTPDGTVQVVYQNSTNPLESKSLKVERNENNIVDLNPFPAKEVIPKPLPTKHNYQKTENTSSNIEYYSHIDMLHNEMHRQYFY